jgi:hypothetical protein
MSLVLLERNLFIFFRGIFLARIEHHRIVRMQLARFCKDEVIKHLPEERRCDKLIEIMEVRNRGIAIELVFEVNCRQVVVMVYF